MTTDNSDFYYAPRAYTFKDHDSIEQSTPKNPPHIMANHAHSTQNMPSQSNPSVDTHQGQTVPNVDAGEIQKFTALAHEWWDKDGAFATLHQINPLRLNWIEQQVIAHQKEGLTGKKVLDVGCGGGILSHSMAKRGASVLGVDLGLENIEAAKINAQKTQQSNLEFDCVAIEDLASDNTHIGTFDVVTCVEMLEHVPNPQSIIDACFALLKPNGVLVLSTINRNPKSYLFAVIGAEYVLRLLPKGTHDYEKFITPAELDRFAERAGCKRQDMIGLHYNPITKHYWLAQNVDVNYMMAVYKPSLAN